VAGSCEHGNELSGSIKGGECLDYLRVPIASQEGLSSMESDIKGKYYNAYEKCLITKFYLA
jgi:hypothetical protein